MNLHKIDVMKLFFQMWLIIKTNNDGKIIEIEKNSFIFFYVNLLSFFMLISAISFSCYRGERFDTITKQSKETRWLARSGRREMARRRLHLERFCLQIPKTGLFRWLLHWFWRQCRFEEQFETLDRRKHITIYPKYEIRNKRVTKTIIYKYKIVLNKY